MLAVAVRHFLSAWVCKLDLQFLMRWDISFKRQHFVLWWFQNHLILKLWLSEIWSLKVPVRAIKVVECTNYFGLMGMPSNFPLGQLSSPTTGIFPGQAPALGVYTSISTAAQSLWGFGSSVSMQRYLLWMSVCDVSCVRLLWNLTFCTDAFPSCVCLPFSMSMSVYECGSPRGRHDTDQFCSQVASPTVAADSRWQCQEQRPGPGHSETSH